MARVNGSTIRTLAALIALTSLSLTAHSRCNGIELHAHRGHFSHPENTLEAVLKALDGGFDAAEIDIQLLADKKWVLHHDPVVGRVIKTTGIVPVSSMTSQTWREASVVDRQGSTAPEKPAFFEEVLQSTDSSASNELSKLNIEIKGKYQCTDIRNAAFQLQNSKFSRSSFFTSIDLEALRCLRVIDSNRYLGVIVAPEISSVQTKSTPINSLISTLKLQAPEALRKAEAKYSNVFNRSLLSENEFNRLKNSFGNVGVHLDVSTLNKYPQLIIHAQRSGIKIYTYSSLGDIFHSKLILEIKRISNLVPSGAVIDGNPSLFCRRLEAAGLYVDKK